MNWLFSRHLSYGQPQGDQQVPQRLKKAHTMSVNVNVALMGSIALLLAAIISSCGGPTVNTTPTPTPAPILSPSPTPTPTPPPVSVTITSPKDGSSVLVEITVEGTASGIPQGEQLWLLVESSGVTGYFPQNGGPVVVSADGTWTASATLGGPNDVGKPFVLYTALVDQNAKQGTDAISLYLTVGAQTHNYIPIDPRTVGIQTISHVTVVRK